MTLPTDWDPDEAVAACSIFPWTGSVWRAHKRRYEATDYGGTLRASGRWHRAPGDPDYEEGPTWPALYTSLDLAVCAFEVQRIISKRGDSTVADLRIYRYSELWVQLAMVIDCRDTNLLGLSRADLLNDDYATSQAVAYAARTLDVEAMLVPSASDIGDNLIIFPDLQRVGSVLQLVVSRDPNLPSPPDSSG